MLLTFYNIIFCTRIYHKIFRYFHSILSDCDLVHIYTLMFIHFILFSLSNKNFKHYPLKILIFILKFASGGEVELLA